MKFQQDLNFPLYFPLKGKLIDKRNVKEKNCFIKRKRKSKLCVKICLMPVIGSGISLFLFFKENK